MWKEIKGYKWPYRINEDGLVQRFWKEKWIDMKPHFGEKLKRPKICMRRADNSCVEVPLVNLMADAFMGGRKPGMVIIHKDGMRLNCSVWNLRFVTQQESGRIYGASRNKPVLKIAPDGSVVDVYKSAAEAAKKERISHSAMLKRCNNQVKNPYIQTGYKYQYEDRITRRSNNG